jgi:hypothetical protein
MHSRLCVLGLLMTVLSGCHMSKSTDTDGSRPMSWSIAESPDFLTPGGTFGTDSVIYHRVAGGSLLPSGEAVITLAVRNAIVYIDSVGGIAALLGGVGDGPGEFRSTPTILHAAGERLLLWDALNSRLTEVKSRRMNVHGRLSLAPRQRPVGLFEDGSIVTTEVAFGTTMSAQTTSPNTLFQVRNGAGGVKTLVGPTAPPPPSYKLSANKFFMQGSRCLPSNLSIVQGSRILIAQSADGRILSLDRQGQLDTVYHTSRRELVTQVMVDAARHVAESQTPALTSSERAEFLRQVGEVGEPLPSTWSDMLWDGSALWLQHARSCFAKTTTGGRVWDVVNIQTGVRAELHVPNEYRLLAAGSDRILAVITDNFEVEHVGVYRILR